MPDELRLILFGITCGLTAGISPGPVTALVVSQTLRYNFTEGLKIAIAPMLTDLPIVGFALLVLSRFEHLQFFLAAVSLIGAVVILYMAIGTLRTREVELHTPSGPPKSVLQGMAANFFQPHPHIFWFGIGAPTILSAWVKSPAAAIGFLVSFLICIVGGKVGVAAMVRLSKGVLPKATYLWIMRGLGVVMLGFAVLLARDGLKYLGQYFGST